MTLLAQVVRIAAGKLLEGRALAVTCCVVLCCMLVAGLWPFHAPQNAVTWLETGNGLRFSASGTIAAGESLYDGPPEPACTIEVWAQPSRREDSNTLLAFWTRQAPDAFALRQSDTDLVVRHEGVLHEGAFYVADVFSPARPAFLTLAAGAQGTAVYRDGKLAAWRPFRLPAGTCGGRLVIGTSPTGSDPWTGTILGLAVYGREITPAEAARHYETWTKKGRPEIGAGERCLALYLFDERGGRTVHNRMARRADLLIPERYVLQDQAFLRPFWKEFDFSWGYARGVLKNVIGLVPLGFVFYAWLMTRMPARRAAVVATFLGTLTSVTIEVTQAWLPTRQSGTTDIFTNTFGAWLGVILYRYVDRRWLAPHPARVGGAVPPGAAVPRNRAATADVFDDSSQSLGTGPQVARFGPCIAHLRPEQNADDRY